MPIQITCGGCGTVFSVEEKYIGKTGKCIKCGLRILIVDQQSQNNNEDAEKIALMSLQSNKEDDQKTVSPRRTFKVRTASPKQKAFANDLGIKFDEDISAREISALIDAALARQEAVACREIEIETHLKTLRECEPEEMVGQMEKRGFNTLMLTWPKPEYSNTSHEVSFKLIGSDNLTMEDVHYGLGLFMFQMLEREGLDFMQYCAKYALPRMSKNA